MSWLIAILGLPALAWSGAVFYLWLRQEKLIFRGNGRAFSDFPEISALGGKAETALRDGHPLRFHYVPAGGEAKAWLLVYHGNAGGADERLDYAKTLAPQGLNVVLHEYPGYAGNLDKVGEWPVLRNALAMFDEVRARAGGLPVFVLGESLGSGVATYVAGRRPVRALVLHTPYTSMADVAASRYPWMPVHAMIRHPMQASIWAPHVGCPVLILHGTEDATVPYRLGQAQARNFAVPPAFVTVRGAGHNNLRDLDREKYWGSIRIFIEQRL